jgi:aminoglycoside phosphotransferase (APT) family kinase protein
VHETIRRILCERLGYAPETIRVTPRPPIDHQSNQLWDIQAGSDSLIGKQFLKPDEWADAPRREFDALTLLAPLDIAPQPVFYDPTVAPLVLYVYMEGDMWPRRQPRAAQLEQLADLWLQFQAAPTKNLWGSRNQNGSLASAGTRLAVWFEQYVEWAETQFPPAQEAVRLTRELMAQHTQAAQQLAQMEPKLAFGRADARFANVIQRPDGRLGLVDWEDSGLRDPARDLADLITHPNQEDLLAWADWQPFFSRYLPAHEQHDPALWERTHLYLALFPLFWLALVTSARVRQMQAGEPLPATFNDLPPNVRLRRYLARALAWPDLECEGLLGELKDVLFFPE